MDHVLLPRNQRDCRTEETRGIEGQRVMQDCHQDQAEVHNPHGVNPEEGVGVWKGRGGKDDR